MNDTDLISDINLISDVENFALFLKKQREHGDPSYKNRLELYSYVLDLVLAKDDYIDQICKCMPVLKPLGTSDAELIKVFIKEACNYRKTIYILDKLETTLDTLELQKAGKNKWYKRGYAKEVLELEIEILREESEILDYLEVAKTNDGINAVLGAQRLNCVRTVLKKEIDIKFHEIFKNKVLILYITHFPHLSSTPCDGYYDLMISFLKALKNNEPDVTEHYSNILKKFSKLKSAMRDNKRNQRSLPLEMIVDSNQMSAYMKELEIYANAGSIN